MGTLIAALDHRKRAQRWVHALLEVLSRGRAGLQDWLWARHPQALGLVQGRESDAVEWRPGQDPSGHDQWRWLVDFERPRGWDGGVNSVMGGLLVAALIWLIVAIVLEERLKARLRRLTPTAADVPSAMRLLFDEYAKGRMNPAAMYALRGCAVRGLGLSTVNVAVCLDVAAGRYVEALSWRELCEAADLKGEKELLLRINEAEAMANLGRVEESIAWLNREPQKSLTIAGVACHRAWCLATLGRVDEARTELAKTTPCQLGLMFRNEWHLTAAAIAIASHQWADAEKALVKARRAAMRASTKRNVDYGRGLLLSAQGRHQEALPHFQQGAAAEYLGQGGQALLAWGDSLAALGRNAEARHAWGLCLERDPQAPAAQAARSRLS